MKGKMRQITMPLFIACIVVLMFLGIDFTAGATTPIDDCTRIVEEYDLDVARDYIDDGKIYTYPTCKTEGYLFAGWYTKETCGKDSYWGKETPGDTVYALFVPSHVLDVKAQLSGNLIDAVSDNDETASIRFVTTVDSELYKKVGFDISYTLGGKKTTITRVSNKVYEKLCAVGENTGEYKEDEKEYTPQGSFCALSKYFKACTVKGLDASLFSMPFSVKPFWITMDGSKVYGDTVIRSIDDYFLEEEVWVSSVDVNAADTEQNGTEEKPFATLDYAFGMVRNQGTIHVKDSYTAGSEFVWTDHDKTATVTGGAVDFSGVPVKTVTENNQSVDRTVLDINDAVTFTKTTLTFADGQHIYANGNSVEITSDIAWGNESANVQIYGGAYNTTLNADTNLVLVKGNYTRVYGGNNKGVLNGDTHVTLSGTINSALATNDAYKEHSSNYVVYGGGTNSSTLKGDTNVTIVNDTVMFNYVFGGSENGTITGDCNVTYAGKAMSVYAGGKSSKITGNTYITMTGGWAEQVFGGCESASITGNTNVDIQAGTVKRRVYGGCYNNLSNSGEWATTNYSVNGHTNVAIGSDATILRNFTQKDPVLGIVDISLDNGLFAISRYASVFPNEKGAFVFNDTSYASAYSGKLGSKSGDTYANKFPSQSYHYLITTNGNTEDGSYGIVTPQNDHIRIQPKHGYSATVIVDENKAYYTESEAAFKLPTMTSEDEPKNIQVIFSDEFTEVDITKCEARIGGAYYDTFEDAVSAAKAMETEDAIVVTLLKDAEVESAMTISTNITIQNEVGRSIKVYRGSGLATTNMFNVTSKGTLTMNGVGTADSMILDGRTQAEADANKDRDSVAGSTGSMISNSGTVNIVNTTVQYVKKDVTSGDGGVINNVAGATLNVKDSLFDNNYTTRYGSVAYSKGAMTIENTMFTNNKAAGNGGVLCNHDGTSFIVNGCTFNGNSGVDGGVIWNNKTATIKNSTFQSNSAAGKGGAILTKVEASSIEGCTFTSNSAVSKGGAVYFETAKFTVKNSRFDGNTATINGGAIYNASNATLDVIGDGTDNSVFVNNKALGAKTKEYEDGTYYGGGAICVGSGTLTVSGYKFTSNETKSDGGAINYRGTTTLTVNDCEFTSNKALKKNDINGLGGAIFMFQGTLNMDVDKATVTTFEGNHATNGGAIAQRAGTANINNADFTSNQGQWNGGALYHKKAVNLTNCKFTSNNTVSKGGAVCSEGGTLNATNCTFTGNASNDEGGAYRLASGGTTTLTGCTFTNNTAKNTGGGAIKFNTGTLTIDGCIFSGNTATKGDVNGHEIKLSTDPTSENGYYRPTIQNSTFDPSKVRNLAGDSNAYIDGGNNKTPYLDEDQEGGNDEDEEIIIP